MEKIRSFIAIELPEELKNELCRLEAQLKSGEFMQVKWVNSDSIHLTLKFLGDIKAESTTGIIKAMEEAARGITPFSLEIRDLGVFPNIKRARVAWVGIKGETEKLLELQHNLETSLNRLGFKPEMRSFTPHLTLARINDSVSLEQRQKAGQLIMGTSFVANTIINVAEISLMRSQLTREGAIYSRIGSVKLGS